MEYKFSKAVVSVPHHDNSYHLAIQPLPDTINLTLADPFDPRPCVPEHVSGAVVRALLEGKTHYSPQLGIPELRSAIARKFEEVTGVKYTPEEVVVTAGSSMALFTGMRLFLEPGDEVINPDPSFAVNFNVPVLCGATNVRLPLREENGFQIDPDEMKRLITKKTKMIMLTNPNNPTAVVYSRETLVAIARLAVDHDLMVLADENFRRLVYDGKEHISIASLPGMRDRTMTIFAFSKDMAMTGFRVGSLIANRKIADLMFNIQRNTVLSANTFAQYGALATINGPLDFFEDWKKIYLRGREVTVEALNSIPGVSCLTPQSAYFAWPNVSPLGSSEEVSKRIAEKAHVMVQPGTWYGEYGEGYLRVSFCHKEEVLREAFDRIKRALGA